MVPQIASETKLSAIRNHVSSWMRLSKWSCEIAPYLWWMPKKRRIPRYGRSFGGITDCYLASFVGTVRTRNCHSKFIILVRFFWLWFVVPSSTIEECKCDVSAMLVPIKGLSFCDTGRWIEGWSYYFCWSREVLLRTSRRQWHFTLWPSLTFLWSTVGREASLLSSRCYLPN